MPAARPAKWAVSSCPPPKRPITPRIFRHLYFDDLTYTGTQAGLQAHRTLRGHTGSVMSVAFSPDGRLLASGCRDRTVRLWDAHTGELRHLLEGYSADVYSVAFAPDGKTLTSASGDPPIRLWDLRTAMPIHTLAGRSDIVRSVTFAPDGQTLASTGADQTVQRRHNYGQPNPRRMAISTGE